jgi:hypothetical protein
MRIEQHVACGVVGRKTPSISFGEKSGLDVGREVEGKQSSDDPGFRITLKHPARRPSHAVLTWIFQLP